MVKKAFLAVFFVFSFCVFSFSQKNEVRQGTSLTLFFSAMDGQGWQLFFMVDAVKRRLPQIKLEIYPLVSKKDGKWDSPRGEAEIKESERIMAIRNKYPAKLLTYLSARSLSPYLEGWRDAMIFSGINPFELSGYINKNSEKLLTEAFNKAEKNRIKNSSLLINGKLYNGEYHILKIIEAINEVLPQSEKINLYKEELAKIKAPIFKVIVTKKIEDWVDENIINVFKRYFPNLVPEKVFYENPEVVSTFGELKFLPAYAIEDNERVRESLAQPINSGVFEKVGGYYIFYNRNSRGILPHLKEEPKKLEIFVMSQCPYGVMAENSIIEAINNSAINKEIEVKINYIADAIKNEKGEIDGFSSLHGDEEWKEDARQLVIKKLYPDKFYAYLIERNKNFSSTQWQDAAKKIGLDIKKIELEAENGKKLLAENIKRANELDINNSPTFLVNGNILVVGLGELARLEEYKNINLKPNSSGGSCNK